MPISVLIDRNDEVRLSVTAFDLAEAIARMDTREVPGPKDNPLILAMLHSVAKWPEHDEVAWCSAACSFTAELLDLPRPELLKYPHEDQSAMGQGPLQARTWLRVGRPVPLSEAKRGFDVVVIKRGLVSPGPEVIDAPGHVFFFSHLVIDQDGSQWVHGIGGNQSNAMGYGRYNADRVLGVRRLLG